MGPSPHRALSRESKALVWRPQLARFAVVEAQAKAVAGQEDQLAINARKRRELRGPVALGHGESPSPVVGIGHPSDLRRPAEPIPPTLTSIARGGEHPPVMVCHSIGSAQQLIDVIGSDAHLLVMRPDQLQIVVSIESPYRLAILIEPDQRPGHVEVDSHRLR